MRRRSFASAPPMAKRVPERDACADRIRTTGADSCCAAVLIDAQPADGGDQRTGPPRRGPSEGPAPPVGLVGGDAAAVVLQGDRAGQPEPAPRGRPPAVAWRVPRGERDREILRAARRRPRPARPAPPPRRARSRSAPAPPRTWSAPPRAARPAAPATARPGRPGGAPGRDRRRWPPRPRRRQRGLVERGRTPQRREPPRAGRASSHGSARLGEERVEHLRQRHRRPGSSPEQTARVDDVMGHVGALDGERRRSRCSGRGRPRSDS